MLTYSFADRGERGLYEHLYHCIRKDIERGTIAPGEKLPSKRSLARHLGVSLITVEGAYAQLVAEGYVRAEPRRGYYACDLGSAPSRSEMHGAASLRTAPPLSAEQPRPVSAHPAPDGATPDALRESSPVKIADFTGAASPAGLFPYGAWAKSVREALVCESEQALIADSSSAGTLRLRSAIADHLRGFRGMAVDPDCVVIGAGSQVLYNWLVQLLGRTVRYGIEDPGYPRLDRIYRANSVSLSHLSLDDQGVSMRAVHAARADVLHLMPSHQYPTGIVTSISRRYELLGWASEAPGRYLVEDDYDCEFRLTGRPIPSLQSIDAAGKVIYANTFAKSLGPAFRVGYLVLPPDLARRYHDELGFYSCTVSAIDQLALARFIENGDYERHVNRLRAHYRSVRDALLAALQASNFAGRLSIEGQDAGIHFLLGMRAAGADAAGWEDRFVRSALTRGVALRPLSAFCADASHAPASDDMLRRFVMSYGGVAPEAVRGAVEALAGAVRDADAG